MNRQPKWQYDEMTQCGTDYADPVEVAAYEDRQRAFLTDRQKRDRAAVEGLGLTPEHVLVDIGAGTGALALLAAARCRRVHAVDVSGAMLAHARQKAREAGAANIEFHRAGFLTYEHAAEPVDAIASQMALHHLPDAWKIIALTRMADMLKPGGRLYLRDLVFTFNPAAYAGVLDAMVGDFARATDEAFARQLEMHLREEFSTFDWIMEGLLARAGFAVDHADYAGMCAEYFCTKGGGS